MSIDSTTPLISAATPSLSYSCIKECVLWRGRRVACLISALLVSTGLAVGAGGIFCLFDPNVKIDLPSWILGITCLVLTIIVCLGAFCLYCYIPSSNSRKLLNESRTIQAGDITIINEERCAEKERGEQVQRNNRSLIETHTKTETLKSSREDLIKKIQAEIDSESSGQEV